MCSFHCREVFLDLRPFLRHQKFKLLIHHNSSLTSRSKLQCRKHRSINRGRRGRVGKAAWKPGDPSSLPDLPLPRPTPAWSSRAEAAVPSPRRPPSPFQRSACLGIVLGIILREHVRNVRLAKEERENIKVVVSHQKTTLGNLMKSPIGVYKK